MKALKIILAIALFTSTFYACTPTEITENDSPELIEQATGGDDETGIDEDKD
ncbi:hypothetical protein [uncultured Lacinutrix sp.]|uniref:hypothetical protein n=1 Tax=uncultured Lacinutrix sp. TaxID=574032 RepID=UPI00260C59F8|nr:hypothetical protein [uncultured Lacinutrix sp.]